MPGLARSPVGESAKRELSESSPALISVIVPIYRVEDYLHRCVSSILAQTYAHLEVILVDDGSDDRCGEICDEFDRTDDRIRVVHKRNGGVSSARNAGLDVATGSYVAFIDGDDWVTPVYVSRLHEWITMADADVAICGMVKVRNASDEPVREIAEDPAVQIVGPEEALRLMLYQREYDGSVWAKLFRAALFDNLRFPEGIVFAEDLCTIYRVFLRSGLTVRSSAREYYYLIRDDGAEGSPYNAGRLDCIAIVDEMVCAVVSVFPQLESAARCRRLSAYFSVLVRLPTSEYRTSARPLRAAMRADRFNVLIDSDARLKLRLAAALSFLGPRATRSAYNLIDLVGKSR